LIRSMTGFGHGEYENDGRSYVVEIKSVNHKYSDINVRIPRFLNQFEDTIRKQISNSISRGKIDVYVQFEDYGSSGTKIRINKELAKQYLSELKDLADETGIEYKVNLIDVSKLPEVLKIEDDENEELIGNEVTIALNEALSNFITMRENEGEKLVEDISERLNFIETKVEEIAGFSSTLVDEYIEKLNTRIQELLKDQPVDENRLNQEIVIFSDKSSIEEELTRLRSHISQFRDLLKTDSPVGKKIDFLIQEMNRETNTIGSKANSLDITNRVIEVKTEIENIREQIQNIE